MNTVWKKSGLISFLFLSPLNAADSVKALWNSLDSSSLTQAFAFYELYPETPEGKIALQRANRLIAGDAEYLSVSLSPYFFSSSSTLSSEALETILGLSKDFPNRQLKGYRACSEKEVLILPAEEIDLGKALLLSQLDGDPELEQKAENYSATLDLMALRVLAKLRKNATPEEKIQAMNTLIFEEMKFRFPPHGLYAKDIDLYTFLPSVMDNHLGVCLGVTALYLAVAQRIELPLEIVTPPGHIYVRYREGERIVNIETTARGIDTPTETYLSVNVAHLPIRNIKEVVGMTHVNQASVYLQQGRFEDAAASYEKAWKYLPEEPLVIELLSISYLLSGRKEEARPLMEKVLTLPDTTSISRGRIPRDYLEGKVDEEGIRAIFLGVDEKRESIVQKQKKLEKVLAKYPFFKEGLEHLAVTWIQLNRAKEAIQILEKYHTLDDQNPVIEYYLAVLHGERQNYAASWEHLKQAEKLTNLLKFSPKALRELRHALTEESPD